MKKNCINCKHGVWDSDDSVSLYFDCEKRDAGEDMKLENNLGRKEYRERAKVCCDLKPEEAIPVSLICPNCGGPHFNVTQFSSKKGGNIICASISFQGKDEKIGCGWTGTIPAKTK